MSFALTTAQVLARTKTVTRRVGWRRARVGDIVQPIEKGQGLKKGERVRKIGGPIQFVSVDQVRLDAITRADVVREGFPGMSPAEFMAMFCKSHRIKGLPCLPADYITRIEFRYLE